ncbi:hypothetical protein GIB67_026521 [Kingdonia uniflora]|uniref:Uncharacterized protein n=1 Tax=Kingdonia uniflora TaxID=39325 RepID=A0A7J7PCG5_9MAGN|nr:hypothetical protein GIB67_026521 [Kingdonia uniflora]
MVVVVTWTPFEDSAIVNWRLLAENNNDNTNGDHDLADVVESPAVDQRYLQINKS